MDKWEQVARDTLAPGHFYGGSPGNEDIAAWAYKRIVWSLRQVEADTIRRCAGVCGEQAEAFLSPEYATSQPLSSLSERIACGEVKEAILSLLPEESAQ